jgi:FkbM family methyltransferase
MLFGFLSKEPSAPTVECSMPAEAALASLRMLQCEGRDQVAGRIGLDGWKAFEPPMPELFYRLAQQLDGVLVDVGANTGFYSLVGVAARKSLKVLAFEPDPKVLPILRDNLKINDVHRRVRVFPIALSDSRGQAHLYVPTQEHGLVETSSSLESDFKSAHSEVIDVPMSTVDDVIAAERIKKVAMIKVDVEGHEAAVLRGARKTVRNHRPILFVEVLPKADIHSLNDFIHERGYKDVRLRTSGVSEPGDTVFFDPEGWNHVFVPSEKLSLVR